jgi:hypothetical protein
VPNHLKEEEVPLDGPGEERMAVKGEDGQQGPNFGYVYYFPPRPQYHSFM